MEITEGEHERLCTHTHTQRTERYTQTDTQNTEEMIERTEEQTMDSVMEGKWLLVG